MAKFKLRLGTLLIGALGAAGFAKAEAVTVTFTAADTEIVVPAAVSPVTEFSAKELKTYLSQVLGAEIPIVTRRTAGRRAIVLCAQELPRDAFSLKSFADRVEIGGRDDPTADLERQLSQGHERALWMQRATLFGVYEFLERFAGVRFYFPGELGEIVPRRRELVCAVDEVLSPRYSIRKYSFHNDRNDREQRWFEPGVDCRSERVRRLKSLQFLRNRMETEQGIPCCHGQRDFRLLERFATSRPEFFALLEDYHAKTFYRDTDPQEKRHHPGQLCHSSAVWDFIGAEAERRVRAGERYIDVMPEDGFQPCQCADCRAAWKAGDANYATELVWSRTAALARRLAPLGGVVTQMAYPPYRRLPDFDLPDNLRVMIAETGPWSLADAEGMEAQRREIRQWAEKTGGKVWIWTYPCKLGRLQLDDIPQLTPRAYGKYYAELEPWIFGAYAESESDAYLANYLNHYVFGKVCWNPQVDVKALLAEHYQLMFADAAPEMERFFKELEMKWLKEVSGKTFDTPLGPKVVCPSDYQLWTEVYSPAVLARWAALLDAAAAKTVAESLAYRRVQLFRREFLEPMVRRGAAYRAATNVAAGLARDRASSRPNLIENGGFESADGWTSRVGRFQSTLDRTEFAEGRASMRLTSTNRSDLVQYLDGRLKPRTRYRVSWCMKLENVQPLAEKSGVYGELIADAYLCLPKLRAPLGTTGWMYQSYEVETGPTIGQRDARPYFHFLIQNATGTVWFDALRIEELPNQGE